MFPTVYHIKSIWVDLVMSKIIHTSVNWALEFSIAFFLFVCIGKKVLLIKSLFIAYSIYFWKEISFYIFKKTWLKKKDLIYKFVMTSYNLFLLKVKVGL